MSCFSPLDCGQPATGYIAADTRYIGVDVAVRCDETNGYYGSAEPALAMCEYDGTWSDGTWYLTGCQKRTYVVYTHKGYNAGWF